MKTIHISARMLSHGCRTHKRTGPDSNRLLNTILSSIGTASAQRFHRPTSVIVQPGVHQNLKLYTYSGAASSLAAEYEDVTGCSFE